MVSKINIGNCEIENCIKPRSAARKCSMHYTRLRRYGTLDRTRNGINPYCKLDNCDNKYYGLGYCKTHYWKLVTTPRYSKNRITFKGKSILLKFNPRIGICSNCKKSVQKGEIKRTDIHHEKYDELNPLNYTIELCTSCHTKETWNLGQIRGRP